MGFLKSFLPDRYQSYGDGIQLRFPHTTTYFPSGFSRTHQTKKIAEAFKKVLANPRRHPSDAIITSELKGIIFLLAAACGVRQHMNQLAATFSYASPESQSSESSRHLKEAASFFGMLESLIRIDSDRVTAGQQGECRIFWFMLARGWNQQLALSLLETVKPRLSKHSDLFVNPILLTSHECQKLEKAGVSIGDFRRIAFSLADNFLPMEIVRMLIDQYMEELNASKSRASIFPSADIERLIFLRSIQFGLRQYVYDAFASASLYQSKSKTFLEDIEHALKNYAFLERRFNEILSATDPQEQILLKNVWANVTMHLNEEILDLLFKKEFGLPAGVIMDLE